MKVTKTKQANLEKRRFGFFQVGLIVACSLALLAFRWTTYELVEENGSKIKLTSFDPIEPELPKMSFRKQPEAVKIQIDNRFFKIDEDPTLIENKAPEPKKISKNITLIALDCPDCDDEDPILDPPMLDPTSSWIKAERTPYFDECSSPGNRKAEAECTYAAIRNFVQSNTKYPQIPRELGIQGTVWITFVINKKGEVSEIEVIKSPHSELSEAAVKGLSQLPKMNPGLQRLNPVDVRLEIPVKFKLK